MYNTFVLCLFFNEKPWLSAILQTNPAWWAWLLPYRQTSNISRTWVGNKIIDHSDVIRASPVVAAPTTSSFST